MATTTDLLTTLDLHPASVAIGAVRWPKTRVLLADGRIYVARALTGIPALVLAEDVEQAHRQRGRYYTVVLVDGREVSVRAGSGCGCTSALKALTRDQMIGLDQ